MGLEFLIFPELYHEWVLDLVKCFFCIQRDDHVVFVFEFVYIMDYVDGFPLLNHPCIPGSKLTWSGWMTALMCSWIWLARILLRIFASIFIREIGLKFSIFAGSFCGLGIRVIVAS